MDKKQHEQAMEYILQFMQAIKELRAKERINTTVTAGWINNRQNDIEWVPIKWDFWDICAQKARHAPW